MDKIIENGRESKLEESPVEDLDPSKPNKKSNVV